MNDDTIIERIYDEDGIVRLEVQRAVEEAIRRFPNVYAEMWVGGVAAIRALLGAIGVDVDAHFNPDDPESVSTPKDVDA